MGPPFQKMPKRRAQSSPDDAPRDVATLFDQIEAGWSKFAISPDGKWIARQVGNGIHVSCLRTKKLMYHERRSRLRNWGDVVWSPSSDSLLLMSFLAYKILLVFPFTEQASKIVQLSVESSILNTHIAWAPSGSLWAYGSVDYDLIIFDYESNKVAKALKGHTSIITSIGWSPSGSVLASGSQDQTVKLWDASTWTLIHTLRHSYPVFALSWSPSGDVMASGSLDTTIRLWDPKTGSMTKTLEGQRSSIMDLAWSPRGDRLASASDDNVVLWDLASGKIEQELVGEVAKHEARVKWAPSGDMLTTCSGLFEIGTEHIQYDIEVWAL